jgi:hypothetical protein
VLLILVTASTSALATVNSDWSPPQNLSDWYGIAGEGGHSLDLGIDGTQLAAWFVSAGPAKWTLRARVRPPGHDWEVGATIVAARDHVFKAVPTMWSSGVAPDGTSWLVWIEIDHSVAGDNMLIGAAHRPPGPGQSWAVDDLTDGAYETSIRTVDMQIGPDGDVAVVWVACAASTIPSDGPCHVRARRWPAGATAWEGIYQTDQAYSGEAIEKAHVVVGPGGLTVVLWVQTDTSNPVKWALLSRAFSPSPAPGGWEANVTNVSGWQTYVLPSPPVCDPGGTVTAAWRSTAPDPSKHAHYANTRPAVGAWNGTPAQISPGRSSYGGLGPTLAVGEDGTVSAAYVDYAGATETYLYANTRQAASTWGGEQLVHGGPNLLIRNQKLGVWPQGAALILFWVADTGRDAHEDSGVFWSMRPPHASWGDGGQDQLGTWCENMSDIALKVALDGSAFAAWSMRDTNHPPPDDYQVLASSWVAGGPFEEPVALSDVHNYAWLGDRTCVLGQFGEPAAVAWEATRSPDLSTAIMYSERMVASNRVYLPVTLRNWP